MTRSHPHDFGTYREVSVRYCGDDRAACDFAFQVEASVPEFWDPVAHQELADLQQLHAEPQALSSVAATVIPANRAHPDGVPPRRPISDKTIGDHPSQPERAQLLAWRGAP